MKKNIKYIILNIIGVFVILFGLICMFANAVFGLGFVLLGLYCFASIRHKIVASKIFNGKRVLSTIACIIVSFALIVCGSSSLATEPVETDNDDIKKSEVIVLDSVDQLIESDKYIDKNIKVTGMVDYEDASTGSMKMFAESSSAVIYLQGSEKYDMPESYCVTVTGIAEKDEYGGTLINVSKLVACTDDDCNHNGTFGSNDSEFTLSDKIDADSRYQNMNWPDFYQYPENYNDGQIYYVVGKVVYIDGAGGGLIQLVEDNIAATVEFSTYGSEQPHLNDIIALYGYVSGDGKFTDSETGKTYNCPFIDVVHYQNGEYNIGDPANLTDEEYDFIYGKYVNEDGYYADYITGESFKLTEDTIAGYPYKVKSLEYTYGSTLVSSYDICSNNMKIMMSIDIEKDGHIVEGYLFIKLDGTADFQYHDATENIGNESTFVKH